MFWNHISPRKTVNKILYQELKPYTLRLFFVLGLMLMTAGLEAFAPWPFKFLIDNVLGDEVINTRTLIGKIFSFFPNQLALGIFIVFMFFLLSILLSFFEYYRSISVKKTIIDIIYKFSTVAFSNMELFDIGFLRKQDTGDYIYRLSYDVQALGNLIEEGVLPLITSVLYLLFTTIIMFTINVKLTLLSLAVLPFLGWGLFYFNKKIVRVSKNSEYWNSTLFTFVEQALTQLKIIQAFSQEKKELNRYTSKVRTALHSELRLYHLNFLLSLVVGIIIAISYSLIIGVGINYFFAGELSTGLLIIFIFYLDNLTNPVLSIIYATTAMKESYVKISRMDEFFRKKSHTMDAGKITIMKDTSITFENVTVLSDQNDPILDNVSFHIEHGKTTVIVGVSGSGKTSIISLIPRLVGEPTSGRVLIGRHDVRDYSVQTLRQNISLVPQENDLFNDTIKNIIMYGNPTCSIEDVENAAKLAIADEFIKNRKYGYDFHVGEGGNYLSGGQRQRIMLARAFARQANILIFDEPLSALDIQTRTRVWNNLQQFAQGKTTIIVSNVLDVITKADHVIVVNKGKIAHAGQHRDLLKDSNLYKLILRTE